MYVKKSIEHKYQPILNKWNINISMKDILNRWSEPQRYYHDQTHLNDLLEQIEITKPNISENEYEKLVLIALFHDIVYIPENRDNEDKSAEFFIQKCTEVNDDILDIKNAILDTKTHNSNNSLSKIFNDFDMSIIESDFNSLLKWEDGIWNEYKSFGKEIYKQSRLKFLNSILKDSNNKDNLQKLIQWVTNHYE